MKAVSELIVASFGEKMYSSFEPGRNRVYILFPDGAALHDGRRHWEFLRWYSPLDVRHLSKDSFGLHAWCKNGATPVNGIVVNWFELLDSWSDITNDHTAASAATVGDACRPFAAQPGASDGTMPEPRV